MKVDYRGRVAPLFNGGRGPIVVTDDPVETLNSGIIGATLDVFEE